MGNERFLPDAWVGGAFACRGSVALAGGGLRAVCLSGNNGVRSEAGPWRRLWRRLSCFRRLEVLEKFID